MKITFDANDLVGLARVARQAAQWIMGILLILGVMFCVKSVVDGTSLRWSTYLLSVQASQEVQRAIAILSSGAAESLKHDDVSCNGVDQFHYMVFGEPGAIYHVFFQTHFASGDLATII